MYVYVLRSVASPATIYIGSTYNLKRRFAEHNAGLCESTCSHLPWFIDVAVFFKSHRKAKNFEEYLKSGSGRAFSKRHF